MSLRLSRSGRAAIFQACLFVLATSQAHAASLVEVPSFGDNPSGAKMFIYVPEQLGAKPPVLAAIHYCGGTASAYYNGTGYKGLADQYHFVIVYPQAPSADGCWDVHSDASLHHDGGGDSAAIVSMVKYALMQHSGDPSRVYATGTSSGAMMTNVLLATYPDVFKAGAAFAGVPYACFAGAGAWNSACATGQVSKTGQQWGDLARAAYPGYAGPRPRMQLWHGTEDEVLDFNNFGEEIKQWTNVLGVSEQPSSTEQNTPQAGFTRTRYKDVGGIARVEAVREQGQPHNLILPAKEVVHFFGLDGSSDPGTGAGGSGNVGGANGGGGVGGTGASAGSGGTPDNTAGSSASSGGSAAEGGGNANGGSSATAGAPSGTAGTAAATAGTSFASGGLGSGGASPAASASASDEGGCSLQPPGPSATARGAVLLLCALAGLARRRRATAGGN